MRKLTIFALVSLASCTGAQAEIFTTVCTFGDSGKGKTFSIVADSVRRNGSTDYRNAEAKIGMGRSRSSLKLLSIQNFDGGLVGIKLFDPASGAKYRVDFIRASRPASSPYKPDDASVAVTGHDGGTTHESCRSE